MTALTSLPWAGGRKHFGHINIPDSSQKNNLAITPLSPLVRGKDSFLIPFSPPMPCVTACPNSQGNILTFSIIKCSEHCETF